MPQEIRTQIQWTNEINGTCDAQCMAGEVELAPAVVEPTLLLSLPRYYSALRLSRLESPVGCFALLAALPLSPFLALLLLRHTPSC